jgi:uncharacterized protein YbbC (DUF1343 family)
MGYFFFHIYKIDLIMIIIHNKNWIFFLFLICSLIGQNFKYSEIEPIPDLSFVKKVYTGLDVLEQMDFSHLKGKTISILCNQASVNRNGRHLLTLLREVEDVHVLAIFLPQYGLFASEDPKLKMMGDKSVDPIFGARIVDLFDRVMYPPEWSIRDADLILIDIQDTGVRYTTYMTTVSKVMEKASEYDTPILLLDRPNPLRGDVMDGPVVRTAYQSLEGYHLVPIRHGLTIGEYAIIVNEMGWLKDLARVKLKIIPMSNWQRTMWMDDTGIPFISILPEVNNIESLLAYMGMNLFKGTNLNVGHGTESPFFRSGAPWISGSLLWNKVNKLNLPGVYFHQIRYVPESTYGEERGPYYAGQNCSGLLMEITNRNTFDPLATSTALMIQEDQMYYG